MSADNTRQEPRPQDDLTATWNRYLQALDDWRNHRSARADEVQRRLDEAIALGRRLAARARMLGAPDK